MNFGIFDNFGAKNSIPVFQAFREGLDRLGLPHTSHNLQADVAVIWSVVWAGRMRNNQQIWQAFRLTNRPVIVLEVGMLKRGITWKMAINGTGSTANHGVGIDPDRPARLGLKLHPWTSRGSDIVIALQRHDSQQWEGQPEAGAWLQDTVDSIRTVSDRPIVIRQHPRQKIHTPPGCRIDDPVKIHGTYDSFDFHRSLENAWAVVNWNSGPGPLSVLAGVPAFVGASSLAAPVANLDWDRIETPKRPERDQWLIDLAHTEWTLEEIGSGHAIQRLLTEI